MAGGTYLGWGGVPPLAGGGTYLGRGGLNLARVRPPPGVDRQTSVKTVPTTYAGGNYSNYQTSCVLWKETRAARSRDSSFPGTDVIDT